ncbi:MAG: DNA/RNA non-specific endonuclease [Saprospiraceae bacterium]|nr:DNA/RNA non-specific endonuclease [Saprospiraceae bacterium]
MKIPITLCLLLLTTAGWSQNLDTEKSRIQSEITALDQQKQALLDQLEQVQLRMIQRDLKAVGLPSEQYVLHSAMALEYSEPHEQARWVAHIISPEVAVGTVGRTNDFRPDPLVTTGSAVEEDYFLKTMNANGTWEYDGFGYDRGHLAPSADFRWSATALSESYFYSNMSPQVAEFNRGRWSELEAQLRNYVETHPGVQLYVVTGPVLEPDLPVIERGVNKVAIPRQFFKVALDLKNNRAIGFIMPNSRLTYPLENFAVSVDAVEQLTGLDFFNRLPDSLETTLEASLDKAAWLPELAQGDVEPLVQPGLPRNHFNTVVAGRYMGSGEVVTVCGTVVGSRYSRSGNLWLNLDKQYPNQLFSVFIRKADLTNFSDDPKTEYENQQVCFTGKVENFNGTPTMNIDREEQVNLYK